METLRVAALWLPLPSSEEGRGALLGIAQCSFQVKRTDSQGRIYIRKAVPDIPTSLGDMILVHRRSKGLRMDELAAKANVTRNTVREWELDLSRPDAALLTLIADWLGIPTSLLMLDAPLHAAVQRDSA